MYINDIANIDIFFFFYLWQPFCSREQNGLRNFGRGHYDEHFFGITLNFGQ